MHPTATLFLDVCVQRDLWPDGAWPLVSRSQAEQVGRLFALARELGIRQGGVVCRHAAVEGPAHGRPGEPGCEHPEGCAPVLPMVVVANDDESVAELVRDRRHAIYVASGCRGSPDDGTTMPRVFDHLTAGVRDAVVFGAGVEYGVARTVDALLRRRIRTHVALDAAGAGDAEAAQHVVAGWKRRGVDGATVATIGRLLTAGARN